VAVTPGVRAVKGPLRALDRVAAVPGRYYAAGLFRVTAWGARHRGSKAAFDADEFEWQISGTEYDAGLLHGVLFSFVALLGALAISVVPTGLDRPALAWLSLAALVVVGVATLGGMSAVRRDLEVVATGEGGSDE